MIDTFDIDKELKRHTDCADELYVARPKLPLKTKEDISQWASSIRDIVKKYNISPLFEYVDDVEYCLLEANEHEQQRLAKKEFYGQLQSFFDDRKSRLGDLFSQQQGNRNQYTSGRFKVIYSIEDCQEHVYIDDIELEYIPPANDESRQNHQWKPLLIAFIKNPAFTLTDISIENAIHTPTLKATELSIDRLKSILNANHENNHNIPRIHISKTYRANRWTLKIAN